MALGAIVVAGGVYTASAVLSDWQVREAARPVPDARVSDGKCTSKIIIHICDATLALRTAAGPVAYSGFFLNLANLLPVSPLDGGRITAVVSPRVWLLGAPMLLALLLFRPRSRVRCRANAACCSVDVTGTNRMLERVTASQMATASFASVLASA